MGWLWALAFALAFASGGRKAIQLSRRGALGIRCWRCRKRVYEDLRDAAAAAAAVLLMDRLGLRLMGSYGKGEGLTLPRILWDLCLLFVVVLRAGSSAVLSAMYLLDVKKGE